MQDDFPAVSPTIFHFASLKKVITLNQDLKPNLNYSIVGNPRPSRTVCKIKRICYPNLFFISQLNSHENSLNFKQQNAMSSGRKVLQCQKLLQCHKFTVTKSITISSYDIISDNNIWNLTFKTVMANFLLLLLKRNEKRMKAVETRRRQRRISISKKSCKPCCVWC